MSLLYIPFLDGRIGYDCRACGSKCCRAGYMILTGDEHKAILRQHPRLALFAGTAPKNHYFYSKIDPRCWFLAPNGLCSVEETLGHAAKPLICRTHPIYFARHGDVTVAALAPGCYWVRDEAPACGSLVTWRDVESSSVELGPVTDALSKAAPWPPDVIAGTLGAEAAIRDASPRFTSFVEYLSWQAAYADGSLGEPSPAAVDEARARLSALERAIGAVLRVELDGCPATADLERVFLDFASLLRVSALGLTPMFGQPGPRLKSIADVHAALPSLLLSLYAYARIADHVGLPGLMSEYNGVYRLFVDGRNRLFALSQLDKEVSPELAREVDCTTPRRVPLGPLRDRSPAGTLAHHLVEMTAGQEPEETMTLLDDVGRAIVNAAAFRRA
jgi:Fe-S-cluster containining protein